MNPDHLKTTTAMSLVDRKIALVEGQIAVLNKKLDKLKAEKRDAIVKRLGIWLDRAFDPDGKVDPHVSVYLDRFVRRYDKYVGVRVGRMVDVDFIGWSLRRSGVVVAGYPTSVEARLSLHDAAELTAGKLDETIRRVLGMGNDIRVDEDEDGSMVAEITAKFVAVGEEDVDQALARATARVAALIKEIDANKARIARALRGRYA